MTESALVFPAASSAVTLIHTLHYTMEAQG